MTASRALRDPTRTCTLLMKAARVHAAVEVLPMDLVGRDAELAFALELLKRSSVAGEALVVTGEPGVGKTALLEEVARHARADGTRVLRGGGSEVSGISLSSLTPAIMPLMSHADRLAAEHRKAISIAVGLTNGRLARPTVVGQALLTLLMAAAADSPVLVLVDDAQWLDPYSGEVLRFLAQRVSGGRIALIVAARTPAVESVNLPGIPRLDLAALSPDAAKSLICSRFPELADRVMRRVVVEAQGNPLALLELPPALSGPQRAAVEALPSILPMTERLQAVFASRIARLPQPARELLLLAALDGTSDLLILGAASPRSDILQDLGSAERDRLVKVDNARHRIEFRHPLTRSAVIELSTAAQRRTAHAALARALSAQPLRRAPHLAASSDKPDESVADQLEHCARHLAHRGEATSAITALTRAADLSPLAADRSRRLAKAAFIGSDMAWQFNAMAELLDRTRDTQLDPGSALLLAAAAAVIMANGDYDFEATHRLLVAAIEAHAGDYDVSSEGLRAAIGSLSMLCLFAGKPDLWPACVAALRRMSPAPPLGLSLQAMTQFDPVRTAHAALGELDQAIVTLSDQVDPEELLRIPTAAVYVDRLAGCRDALRRQIADTGGSGATARIAVARMNLWVDAFGSGRWDEAQQLAEDGLAECTAAGAGLYAQVSGFQLAMLAAARGDHAAVTRLTDDLIAWGAARGARLGQVFAWHARTLDALGRGDAEEAYQYAAAISTPGSFPPYEATALWVCFDLVVAASLSGRSDAAQAHVAAIEAERISELSPRLMLLACGAAGVAATDESAARAAFEKALAVGAADRWPFEKARVQLAYGRRLSRAGARLEARAVLQAAHATFGKLGAQPWVALTLRELRAVRSGPAMPATNAVAGLTPQELEIAQLAAQGYSNKEIGVRLHLSHRTVSTHLYRLFPKLGVTARAGLRDALTRGSEG
jgi:DNA-binding CsgD family transcriptional regulator